MGYVLLRFPVDKQLFSILLGAGGIVGLGLLDDRYDLKPLLRLIITAVIVSTVVMSGLGIPYISNPFGGVIRLDSPLFTLDIWGKNILVLADIVAIIWILSLMNFVSWSSGLDGQLSGFVAVAFFFYGVLCPSSGCL
ncbi:MAG: Glycosyl transferase family 4 [Microgenomates bacterium OLB22]|nr:MAG: Glycosyl transferase family 4 [Microgenomates bacterium OLB22]